MASPPSQKRRLYAGGSHAVAAALGWRTQRRQRHSSAGLQAAAELVREYLAGAPAGERERMPVHRKLLARGRHDVRYALQVSGQLLHDRTQRDCMWPGAHLLLHVKLRARR